MPRLEMIDDTHSVYKYDLPLQIAIEQRERIGEWFRAGAVSSDKIIWVL